MIFPVSANLLEAGELQVDVLKTDKERPQNMNIN